MDIITNITSYIIPFITTYFWEILLFIFLLIASPGSLFWEAVYIIAFGYNKTAYILIAILTITTGYYKSTKKKNDSNKDENE